MARKLIIFDFDGVLVRTAEIGYLLHSELNPTFSREYFARLSLGNFLENMNRAIAEDGYKVQEDWEGQYHEKLMQLEPHEVIAALIKDLGDSYRLAIVSSSLSYHIRAFLKKEGIEQCFADVLGSDVHQSKVVKITGLLAESGARAAETLFVTDTLGDIREGNACGVVSIGVTWGTHDRATLEEGHPLAVVDTVFELRDEIGRFFNVQDSTA